MHTSITSQKKHKEINSLSNIKKLIASLHVYGALNLSLCAMDNKNALMSSFIMYVADHAGCETFYFIDLSLS